MPRWVKVFIVVGVILVLGFVVTLIAGVEHGPGMHGPGGTPTGQASPFEHAP